MENIYKQKKKQKHECVKNNNPEALLVTTVVMCFTTCHCHRVFISFCSHLNSVFFFFSVTLCLAFLSQGVHAVNTSCSGSCCLRRELSLSLPL